jgi:hypothetical protein
MQNIFFYYEIEKYISVSHIIAAFSPVIYMLTYFIFSANSADGFGNSRRHGVPECEEVYTQVRLYYILFRLFNVHSIRLSSNRLCKVSLISCALTFFL